ncbi:nucleotidyltransferase family protein [Pseudogracilibacillus sp. ICA-222130]|uniref:nucleotidyltransferase family protein n=1 Tax=Pseudogracilibacillus sp. ICA-222130 TaxID=3134655 RepID=UPI0030C388FC
MCKEPINACVLAAGKGSKMGRTKQLLPFSEKPMLQHVIDKILAFPFHHVYGVIGHEYEKIMESVQVHDERFSWLINHTYKEGQSTSLKRVFEISSQPIVIFLGDVLFIQDDTIKRVIKNGQQYTCDMPIMIRPKHKGKVGHPVYVNNIPPQIVDQLRGDEGLRAIQTEKIKRVFIEVDDPFIHEDIDTFEQYKVALAKWNDVEHD